jgi:hypothetical protein
MNKRQKEKAAHLWALSLVSHVELIAESNEANEIRQLAQNRANRTLDQLGYDAADLLTEDDCLRAVAP